MRIVLVCVLPEDKLPDGDSWQGERVRELKDILAQVNAQNTACRDIKSCRKVIKETEAGSTEREKAIEEFLLNKAIIVSTSRELHGTF